MAPDGLSSGFDAIRPWRGSTSRAFEELCYQLFKSDAPKGRAIRTGNPDGGVEWYATLPDDTEWGWQAKHAHDVDSLLNGMTQSVRAVVQDRPKLRKLTFLISSNLSTGLAGGRQKSQRQKYDDKVEFWRSEVDGGALLEFDLIQESDILDRLALPQHQGRRWFWFHDVEFTDAWLSDKLREQVAAAGEKYRPDLQVDLPIEGDLAAVGFDATTLERLDRLRRGVVSEAGDMWLKEEGSEELVKAYEAITAATDQMKTAASEFYIEPSTIESDLSPLREAFDEMSKTVAAAADIEYAVEQEWRSQHPKQDRYAVQSNTPQQARGYPCNRVLDRITELDRWLASSQGQALQGGLYFLGGVAGSGKTHLLLEATHRALQAGRPAVFLSAARFGHGDLWAGICDQLGLPPLGADVLLGAMDAAGEASAFTGRRFVISIDALNETPDTQYWRIHLPALRAAVSQRPHVALVVSCRDTYVRIVCDESEQDHYVSRSHPGFAGHEVDATQKFFAFHGLQAPRIPLLVPEFSLPLFLRLFCEGLRDSGESAYGGHEGRVTIFQRYLDSKLIRIARRVRPQAGSDYEQSVAHKQVSAVLDALLDEFAETGNEGLSLTRAEELAAEALDSASNETAVVLGAMQSEGVLNQELLYLEEGDPQQGLRILFQALADYMILRRRLDRSEDPLSDDAVRAWLRDECSWGILEAAAVVLPELHGVELPDLLGIKVKELRRPEAEDHDALRRYNRDRQIALSVVRSLPYRDSAAVTDRTVELLNESLRFVRSEDLFRIMFTIAPQPANQLNGDRLHRHLAQFRMPDRDEYFGFPTYDEFSDESSPAAVLARWASKGPYPDYEAQVIELASIPLMWLLLSPNRFMRDWVTKALVELLRGHIAVMEQLVTRFWPINDPYIVQRVFVIAYGALMRSDESQRDDAKRLVSRVRKLVFTKPVRADEILLDAARGIVEWGVANGVAAKSQLKSSRRPYGLKPPGPVPSEEKLQEKYGWREGQPDEERYSSVLTSVLSHGDFGRYVVQPGVDMFSRHPLSKPYPEPEAEPEDGGKIVQARWSRFLRSLEQGQREQLDSLLKADSSEVLLDQLEVMRSSFSASLTPEQFELYWNSFRRPRKSRFRDDSYPSDRARRWVFMRVLRLGWTPKQFGAQDRFLGQGRGGREGHKAERWGKKYQWMAYHELLARVADNYHTARRYSDHQDYEGLHQLIADREIDSSLPPVPFHQLSEPETGNDTWRPSPVAFPAWPPVPINFQHMADSLTRFIGDVGTEPTPDRVVILNDSAGDPWVLLDANIPQGDPEADKPWLGLQQAFYLNSWFIPSSNSRRLLPHLPQTIHTDHHDLVDTHGHADCCYFGEIGWTPHNCYHRNADPFALEAGGETFQVVSSVEDYLWEGSLYDCSIGESVSATLPSTYIHSRSSLNLDEHGPSWLEKGEVVFTNCLGSERDGQRGFLARASWLSTFMKAHDVELLVAASTLRWRVTGELSHSHEPDPEQGDRLDVYSAVRIDSDLSLELAPALRLLNREEVGSPAD